MNRLYLADWSQGLNDQEFSQALAAAGLNPDRPLAWASGSPSPHRPVGARFVWRLTLKEVAGLAPAAAMLQQWHSLISAHQNISLVVKHPLSAQFEEAWEWVRTLGSVTNVSGVTLEGSPKWPLAMAWRLPISIGCLFTDEASQYLLERNRFAATELALSICRH